jgi:acylphosphatase
MDASAPESSAVSTVTRHLRITGRVQGVGYRYHLAQEARRLCVVGWVRNRSDGSVEALVHGPVADVEALIIWAHHGPPLARVAGVAVSEVPEAALVGTGFEQQETV